jgi:hypothetical protein
MTWSIYSRELFQRSGNSHSYRDHSCVLSILAYTPRYIVRRSDYRCRRHDSARIRSNMWYHNDQRRRLLKYNNNIFIFQSKMSCQIRHKRTHQLNNNEYDKFLQVTCTCDGIRDCLWLNSVSKLFQVVYGWPLSFCYSARKALLTLSLSPRMCNCTGTTKKHTHIYCMLWCNMYLQIYDLLFSHACPL